MYTNTQKLKATIMLFGIFGPLVGGITFFYLIYFSELLGLDPFTSFDVPQSEDSNFILRFFFTILFFFIAFPITFPISYGFGLLPALLTGYILWLIFRKSVPSLLVLLSWACAIGILVTILYALILVISWPDFADINDLFTFGMSAFFYIPGAVSSITCMYFLRKHYAYQPNNKFNHGHS
tara:strand:+ start:89126 stop:89665 length:540 start_codon:yes stop_codon:yes gene_type:complete